MARTSWNPEVGPMPANKGGTHGGINPAGGHVVDDVPVQGDHPGNSGHRDAAFPWEGVDATPKPGGDLPPLKSLGDGSYGNP